jgi:hypothetical protein
VQQDTSIRTSVSKGSASRQAGKRAVHVVLFVALAVVPVLALHSFATADTGTDPRPAPDAEHRCRAPEACGLGGGHARQLGRTLTDEQRRCLTDHGVTLPPTSTESRATVRAAAEACGLPARPGGGPRGGAATI